MLSFGGAFTCSRHLCLPASDLRGGGTYGVSVKRSACGWYHPCLRRCVHETRNRLADDGAIVLWRMRRANGLESHAVIGPRSDGAVVVWFINGHVIGYRDFSDWTSALGWSERLQAQNWAVGWRLASE